MAMSLLQLCARATTHPSLKQLLADRCHGISDWDALLVLAEQQGLAPLLQWHLQGLEFSLPENARRALHLLVLRHRQCNQAMATTLHGVLDLYRQAAIDVLVLKGAALAHTVYPEIGLRPMRDIDLLVRPEQAQQAQDLLIAEGFTVSNGPRPDDHFHLPALYKKAAGITVCIELHTGFFPNCPPWYRKPVFDDLMSRAKTFTVQGCPASCLGHADMLWHVFEHGFHMPLTYEPSKLISAADLVTMVETKFTEIDWPQMAREHPRILAALPLLHHLTPWSESVSTALSLQIRSVPGGVGEMFQGWPHLRLAEQRDKKLLPLLRDTFWPPEWWARLYYGVTGGCEWVLCRLLTHPRHVFWWVRLYAAFLEPQREGCDAAGGQKALGGKENRRLSATVVLVFKKILRKS